VSKNTGKAGVCKYGVAGQNQSYSGRASQKPANATVGQGMSSQNKPSHASPQHGVTGQKGATSGGGKGPAGRLPRA
jgi:hypothetical protein